MLAGSEVYDEPAADASPAGLFTMPLDAAAGPGQLFTVVEAAARTDDAIGEVSAWAIEEMTGGQRVDQGVDGFGHFGKGKEAHRK